MFGTSRVRVAVVAAVVASFVAPGAAYGLATTTTTTTVGGPHIPSPSDSTTTTVPSTGPTTTTTIPGPPTAMPTFALPTDSGLKLLQTMQLAQAQVKSAQAALPGAQRGVVAARRRTPPRAVT